MKIANTSSAQALILLSALFLLVPNQAVAEYSDNETTADFSYISNTNIPIVQFKNANDAPNEVAAAVDVPVDSESEVLLVSHERRIFPKRAIEICDEECASEGVASNGCIDRDWRVYADFLYLRPANVGINYGVVVDGPIVSGEVPIQIGSIGVASPSYEPGFRVGFSRALSQFADIGFSYTHLDTKITDRLTGTPGTPIQSLVIHPSSTNADDEWLSAMASHSVNFKFADINYRHLFASDNNYKLRYLMGVRYGRLEQRFNSTFSLTGNESINSGVTFDGGGFRLGIEGERVSQRSGLLFYGQANASFLAGEFRAGYFQGNSSDPVIVNTSWKEARIVTIPEIELGIGWQNKSGRFRFTCGYMMSAWLDAVKTGDFIQAIQTNKYNGLNNKIQFDGLVMRTEYVW